MWWVFCIARIGREGDLKLGVGELEKGRKKVETRSYVFCGARITRENKGMSHLTHFPKPNTGTH